MKRLLCKLPVCKNQQRTCVFTSLSTSLPISCIHATPLKRTRKYSVKISNNIDGKPYKYKPLYGTNLAQESIPTFASLLFLFFERNEPQKMLNLLEYANSHTDVPTLFFNFTLCTLLLLNAPQSQVDQLLQLMQTTKKKNEMTYSVLLQTSQHLADTELYEQTMNEVKEKRINLSAAKDFKILFSTPNQVLRSFFSPTLINRADKMEKIKMLPAGEEKKKQLREMLETLKQETPNAPGNVAAVMAVHEVAKTSLPEAIRQLEELAAAGYRTTIMIHGLLSSVDRLMRTKKELSSLHDILSQLWLIATNSSFEFNTPVYQYFIYVARKCKFDSLVDTIWGHLAANMKSVSTVSNSRIILDSKTCAMLLRSAYSSGNRPMLFSVRSYMNEIKLEPDAILVSTMVLAQAKLFPSNTQEIKDILSTYNHSKELNDIDLNTIGHLHNLVKTLSTAYRYFILACKAVYDLDRKASYHVLLPVLEYIENDFLNAPRIVSRVFAYHDRFPSEGRSDFKSFEVVLWDFVRDLDRNGAVCAQVKAFIERVQKAVQGSSLSAGDGSEEKRFGDHRKDAEYDENWDES